MAALALQSVRVSNLPWSHSQSARNPPPPPALLGLASQLQSDPNMHGCQGAGERGSVRSPQPGAGAGGGVNPEGSCKCSPLHKCLPSPPRPPAEPCHQLSAGPAEEAAHPGPQLGLLRGHRTAGCWLPEPQTGRGGRGPLRMPRSGSGLPQEAPSLDPPTHIRKKVGMRAGESVSVSLGGLWGG